MKEVILFVLFSIPFLSTLGTDRFVEDSVKIDGIIRRYVMFLPDGLPENAPLVFGLHGYGGGIDKNFYMVDAARLHKFAVCIPEGLKDPKGSRGWNVGYPSQEGWKQDDISQLQKWAKWIQKKYKLSRENTFMTGMSNGADICYYMAYCKQNTFKAFGAVSGLTMFWIYQKMEAPRPMPIMEIHGTEDRISRYEGDMANEDGWGAYISMPLAVNYWVAKNHCSREEVKRVESLTPQNGRHIIQRKYLDGKDGCDVWFYEVIGGGHTWHTEDMDTGEEIWKFFSQYLK